MFNTFTANNKYIVFHKPKLMPVVYEFASVSYFLKPQGVSVFLRLTGQRLRSFSKSVSWL